MRRLRRVLARLLLGVIGLIAIGLLILHTNAVQSRVLGWSIREVERRFDLDLTADDLHYNLPARRVVMTNVRLAAVGHHDAPFFTADAVTVRLPWAAYAGRLRFDEVQIQRGAVMITRDSQGVSNLPPGRGRRDPNAPPRRVDIRGVRIDRLDFLYRDLGRDIEIRAPGFSSALVETPEGADGPFAIDAGVNVRVRTREVSIAPISGQMTFDGSGVSLGDVRLDTSEGDFVMNGDIVRALDRPTLDLRFTGTADIASAYKWTTPPVTVAGHASLDATMTGAPTSFVLDAHVVARDAQVGDQRGVGIDAQSRLTPGGIAVSKSMITPPTGGVIRATADVPFGQGVSWWVSAEYEGLDAATAFRLAEVEPLPFGAALSGHARLDREGSAPFGLVITNRASPRATPGTAPIEGEVEFVVEGSRWRADQRHRVGGTRAEGLIGGVWNRQAVRQSTFDGRLAVETTDVGEAARYAALFGLDTPDLVRNTTGPMQADVELGGVFVDPRFAGTARTDGVELPSIGRMAFTTAFDASASALNATNIDAQIEGASLRGEVLANFDTRQFTGALTVSAPSAAALMSAVPEQLRLQGPLDARVTFGGTVDAPDIEVDVSGNALTLAGQPIQSVAAKGRVINNGISIDKFAVQQAEGALRGSGRYEWGTNSYTVDLDGQDLVWRGTFARVGDAAVRFSLKFNGAGTLDRPQGEGVAEFNVSGPLADRLVDKGMLNVRLNGDVALVTGNVPSLGAFLSARIEPQQPFPYEAVVVMNRIRLEPVVALAGLAPGHVTGQVSLSAIATGTLRDIAGSPVFINLQNIDAMVADVPLRLALPSRLSWDATGLTIDSLDLAVGSGKLHAAGHLGQGGVEKAEWQTSFAGDLGDLLKIGRPFGVPDDLVGLGPIAFDWSSTGGLERSTATVSLAGGSLAWGSLPAVRDLDIDAQFDGRTLNVSRLSGHWQDGGILGSASIPREVLESRDQPAVSLAQAGTVHLRVTGLSEEALAPWVSRPTLTAIDGRVSGTLEARLTQASLDGLTGLLTLDEAAFILAGVSVSQIRPSVVDVQGGLLTIRDVAFDAGGSPLTLAGSVQLTPADKRIVDLDLTGTADLRIVSAFAPTVAAEGDAKIKVGIGGTLTTPVFNGRVDVAGAEVALRDPRVLISDLNGTIALDGQRVLFDSLRGSANGGSLALDGGFLLEGFRPAAGGLTAVIDDAALEYPQGLQSEADAIVTLRPSPAGWTLTGDITVERSAYNETISLPALIAARRSRPTGIAGEENWAERLRLNLFVSTLQDLRIDNNYGRIEAGAALRVAGTVAEPVLSGRVTLREGGEVYLAGNTFYISRGSISFTNPNRIVPEFDIELRTLVSNSDLLLRIEGPLDRLETDVTSSDPTIDSREAMAMLFGGLRGEDAVTLLSAELLAPTGRAIGLDTLRVERGFDLDEFRADPGLIATETDPATRLTLSKRLRPDVELILSQNLRESGGLSAIVSYRPRRNIEIRAVSRDNLDRSIALRHEITFGGSGTAVGADADVRPVITGVTLSGAFGIPREELVSLLALETGDEFDFHRWQRDIDRLREAFHDRNYYEVRVRGAREVSEDGRTVVLDYRIEPGPVSELILEGHPLERELERELREAWRRTIFDRFLLEDLRGRILRHLMEENVIGSTVEAQVIESTSERKRIRVVVTAGTTVARRELRVSGNRAFKQDRLASVVEDAGLGVEGWLDPPRIAEALEFFYRSEGYLSAAVEAGAPAISGNAGVLPVKVTEGPLFVVGALTFPGVSPDRLPMVAAAAQLDSGVPFVTADIDQARERIETAYARLGFNTLQIEVNADPDLDAGTVALEFAILEGLQQVLREVTTSGATRTDEAVMRRALRLRIGEPVNLADWSQARKRMYDTNVFLQVDIEPVPLPPTVEDSAAGIQPVRAVVRVVEYPVWRFRYGMQLNDEKSVVPDVDGDTRTQNLGVLADLQNQNLFGWAVTAGMAVRYERDRQAASLFTSNGSFFGLPIRSSGFVFGSRQRFRTDNAPDTTDERVGLSAEQRWRPFRYSELIWSYRFERSHVSLATTDPTIPLDEVTYSSRLNLGVVLDRRDDPTDPTRGWFTAANWDQAVQILGSDYAAGRLLVQQSAYRALGGATLAGRAQIGTGYGGDELIVSDRFLLGGATTVRGYAENALGPRDAFGLPAGGDALLAVNGELRFPVRGWVQGVAFVDAGNVFATRGDLSFGDLAVGYGIGLRLASPFAMLRVDFGIPARTLTADRPANQFKSGRWYFGIGHIF